MVPNPVFATKECVFPVIFNFGDSNSDTDDLAASLVAPTPPYGETYFHRPAGRFADGRLIIDFIAKSFGFPYLSAYLDSLGTNFSHGATMQQQHQQLDSQLVLYLRVDSVPSTLIFSTLNSEISSTEHNSLENKVKIEVNT